MNELWPDTSRSALAEAFQAAVQPAVRPLHLLFRQQAAGAAEPGPLYETAERGGMPVTAARLAEIKATADVLAVCFVGTGSKPDTDET